MAGRRTNVALLVLLALALVSGGFSYAIGSGWGAWVVALHAVVGIAIVGLAPWKRVIVRRGLRRQREGTMASLVFTILVVVALVAGFGHSTGILRSMGGLTAMQVHVAAALFSIPFGVFHVVTRRVLPRRTDMTRRNLVRAGVVAGSATAAYVAVERVAAPLLLPGGDRRFTGSYERGSFHPSDMPVTQWLDDDVPAVDGERWVLTVRSGGELRKWTHDELLAFEDRVRATLDCTGGWYSHQDWSGVQFERLIQGSAGRSIRVESLTGYARRFPRSDASNLLLATRVGGNLLSAGHGFPARVVAPGRRGFWWVKWVSRIDVDDVPWWLQSPFPLT